MRDGSTKFNACAARVNGIDQPMHLEDFAFFFVAVDDQTSARPWGCACHVRLHRRRIVSLGITLVQGPHSVPDVAASSRWNKGRLPCRLQRRTGA